MSILRNGFIFLLMFAVISSVIFILELFVINTTGNQENIYWTSIPREQIMIFRNKSMSNTTGIIRDYVKQNDSKGSDAVWQNVTGTRYKFYVYSAYLDDRRPNNMFIRIIAVTATTNYDRVYCLISYDQETVNIAARIQIIRENWNLKYSAAFVLCPIRNTAIYGIPRYVSVITYMKEIVSSNSLYVHNWTLLKDKHKNGTTINACVKPLHFHYNDTSRLIEFIELNRLLGVKQFTFYNHTIGTALNCLLQEYVKLGIVTVLPWQLDVQSQVEIRTEAMFAALNDCLYRSMYKYDLVMVIDLDEVIIPKTHRTLPELIRFLENQNKGMAIGSYSFQNVFFYLQWPDDKQTRFSSFGKQLQPLITLRKARRTAKPHPHKQRSKYICKAEYAVEVGNHFIWQFVNHQVTLNVLSKYGLLHHYRICEFGGNDCTKTNSTIDRTVYRYKESLLENFNYWQSKFKSACQVPPMIR